MKKLHVLFTIVPFKPLPEDWVVFLFKKKKKSDNFSGSMHVTTIKNNYFEDGKLRTAHSNQSINEELIEISSTVP